MPSGRITRFDEFELDEDLFQLRKAGVVVQLEPRAFDLLRYLITHRDRVVSKDELLDEVWSGQVVSESVLPTHVRTLRRALGDDRRTQSLIQTVYGRGYRFVGELEGDREAPSDAGARTTRPFVGRESVLAELAATLDRVSSGRGAVTLLAGEPGIGKTRTAQEICALAAGRGYRVLAGTSYEGEGAPAFWPWIQILRASIADRAPADLDRAIGRERTALAQLVPELGTTGFESSEAASANTQETRFRLFDAITRYLQRTAAEQPLALFLDDLHWADHPSLLLLRFLARELARSRILVLGAYRDVEVRRGHPLRKILGELAREDDYRRVALRGLEREDVAHYLRDATRTDASTTVVEAVHDRTEGNPFFLVEMVALMEEGAEWAASLPEGVREAIGRRLDGLSEECNALLADAAVLGREFDLVAVEALSGVERTAVLERLGEARGHGTIEATIDTMGRYSFSHALVRETLYEELSAPARVQKHRRAGEALIEIHRTNLGPHLTEIAHHFFQAAAGGTTDAAVEYSRRAAERAMSLLAWEEAAVHYERVLEALALSSPIDAPARGETLLALGDAYSRAGERDRARRCFSECADIARELGDAELLAYAAVGMCGRGGPYEGTPLADEPLSRTLDDALRAAGSDDSAWRAVLLAKRATIHPQSTRWDEQRRLIDEATAIARRAAEPWALLQVLITRAHVLAPHGAISENLELGKELISLADAFTERRAARFRQRDPQWTGLTLRYSAFLAQGDIVLAERELGRLETIADEQREPFQHFSVSLMKFGRALAAGRYAEAEREIEVGRKVGERISLIRSLNFFLQQLLLARDLGPTSLPPFLREPSFGNVETLIPFEQLGWRAPRDTGDPARATEMWVLQNVEDDAPYLARIIRTFIATMFMLIGWDEEAKRSLVRISSDQFRDVASDAVAHLLLALACDVAVHYGEREICAQIFDALEPSAGRNVTHASEHVYLGSASHFLGRAAQVLDRHEEAVELLQAGLDMNASMGSWAPVARGELAIADSLAALGDRKGARKMRSQGRDRAQNLGMGALTA